MFISVPFAAIFKSFACLWRNWVGYPGILFPYRWLNHNCANMASREDDEDSYSSLARWVTLTRAQWSYGGSKSTGTHYTANKQLVLIGSLKWKTSTCTQLPINEYSWTDTLPTSGEQPRLILSWRLMGTSPATTEMLGFYPPPHPPWWTGQTYTEMMHHRLELAINGDKLVIPACCHGGEWQW